MRQTLGNRELFFSDQVLISYRSFGGWGALRSVHAWGPRVQNPLWLTWPRAKARAEARCRGPAQLDLAADGVDWTEG
jgi:hypothetical protein